MYICYNTHPDMAARPELGDEQKENAFEPLWFKWNALGGEVIT